MYKVPTEEVAQWLGQPHYNEQLPETLLSTCPYCANRPVPFVIVWSTNRYSSGDAYVQTHISGASQCGVCKKQIFLLHLSSRQNDQIDVVGGVYMFPEPPINGRFGTHIHTLSPNFVRIYQQAAKAEFMGLEEIAGPGYRKALEFLVKDYLISIELGDQAKKNEIAGRGLHRCITDLNNPKLQAGANAAKLTGNDQSHYVNIQGNDLEDLKRFIAITIHWLEIELETQALIASTSQS